MCVLLGEGEEMGEAGGGWGCGGEREGEGEGDGEGWVLPLLTSVRCSLALLALIGVITR